MDYNNYCIKCGSTTKKLLHHHEKYLEIHGYDKCVLMCSSCHRKIHNRLRREGKCKISTGKLNKISGMAKNRRPGIKENQKEYKRNHQKEIKEYNKEYKQQNVSIIEFDERMLPYIQLHDAIQYNYKTGHVSVSSYFQGNKGKKLIYMDIDN